jgi:ABC-type antimicrobial peptide transport system permease subunit
LRDVDPGVPMVESATMDAEIRASLWQERLVAILAGFFGAVSVVLAGIGLYGALALSVAQRQRELGIRVAVGAQVGDVVRTVCAPMAVALALGLAAGVVASGWLLRATRPVLYGVGTMDPASLAAAAGVLVVCGVAAAIPPARRASRVDPAVTLRES